MPVQPKGVVLLRSGTSGIPYGLPISMLGHSLIMRAGCVHQQAALASSGRYFAALATRILDSNLLESPFRPADADGNLSVKLGDSFDVAVTGGDSDGMVTLSRVTGPRPKDWEGLTNAFDSKEIIAGRVTGSVKGGLSDISWSLVDDPAAALTIGDVLDVKVPKVGKQSGKISLGLKQMSGDPWETAATKLILKQLEATSMEQFGQESAVGDRVSGLVLR